MLDLMSEIRNYCIENKLFSCGTNYQYRKMFSCLYDKVVDYKKVATIIWVCSETTKTIEDIEKDLFEIAMQ